MRFKTFLVTFFIGLISIFVLHGLFIHINYRYTPTANPVDLTALLEQTSFSKTDYDLLFEQTGLTQPIIDELALQPDFKQKVLQFQKDYLKDVNLKLEFLPPLTISEVIGEVWKDEPIYPLAPYHNGYIFFTKSVYTMNWRHGHTGIVVDEVRGITLEALNPGSYSMEQPIEKWQYYPTFKMMRLKDASLEELDEIAQYANTHLKGLPYNILADKNQNDAPIDTHCSLLVWQAFDHFGYDLDATGGLFVSPQNMAASPLLELLQIYGFDPNGGW